MDGPLISKLTLGTVQFGLDYGVANSFGKPSYETARNIISKAFDSGVTAFDTAAAYGESEKVLGRAFDELGIAGSVVPITKTAHIPEETRDAEAERLFEASILSSLSNLRLDSLPLLLMHTEKDIRYWNAIRKFRDKGLAARLGISIDTAAAADSALNLDGVEAIQVPMNILDRRFRDDFLKKAKKYKMFALHHS
jgi:aryl-alcohol dehydrogenase-like predicted oxidoreductase